MRRWDHCHICVLAPDLNTELAHYGAQGWELVNLFWHDNLEFYELTFKRPIPEMKIAPA